MLLDTAEQITMYRLLAIRSALGLYVKGLGFRNFNPANEARAILGSATRNKAKLYAEFDKYVEGCKAQYGRAN